MSDKIDSILDRVHKMDKLEVQDYHKQVYKSKEYIGENSFKAIIKALDERLDTFRDEVSPMASMASIDYD